MKKMVYLILMGLIAVGTMAAGSKRDSGASSTAAAKSEEHPLFMHIPGGTYLMGPAVMFGAETESQPEVTISSYYMATYPVKQKEYQEIMAANPSTFTGDNRPVDQISWYDAIEFCNRMSRREGLTPAYTIEGTNVTWDRSANGYRLPTEAEWEYAARAGANTTFPSDGLHPWGLHDMPCGIWEWCWDWYDRYQAGKFTDHAGPENGKTRVLRAGTSFHSPRSEMIRLRSHGAPDGYGLAIGFRMVRNRIKNVLPQAAVPPGP